MPDGSEFPRSFEWIYELAPGIESIPDLYARINQISRVLRIAAACTQGHLAALRVLMLTTLRRHALPELLTLEFDFALDVGARVALCTIEVPELIKLPLVKKRKAWVAATSDTDRKKASDYILHALCIRAAYLVAMGYPGDFFDTVAVNACQKWFDPAIGQPMEGIVASLQAPENVLCQLEPDRLDAKARFRHLSGISTPNLLNATPIRPIFLMNTNDKRIVANKDVASQLEEATNLAAMPAPRQPSLRVDVC